MMFKWTPVVVISTCLFGTALNVNAHTYREKDSPDKDGVKVKCLNSGSRYAKSISEARKLVLNLMNKTGAPGVTVAVSVDGKTVWSEGFGFADVENRVTCTNKTVMKIASLSKPITMTIASHLVESGKLDLEKDIGVYVPSWPKKTWNGEKVIITTRMLSSHMAGIRDYKRINKKQKDSHETVDSDSHSEFEFEEYYIKNKYKSVKQSLVIFKNDDLVDSPGNSFHYSTHGYTLLSAVLEGSSGSKFPDLIKELFTDMGMVSSYLDFQENVIYNRARYYIRSKSGELKNAPFTESSFKLAGAGMLSTAEDMVTFGNNILHSYQCNRKIYTTNFCNGYLKGETVSKLWTPVKGTRVSWHHHGLYGMGWQIVPFDDDTQLRLTDNGSNGSTQNQQAKKYVYGHTGGTIGASSAFLILPFQDQDNSQDMDTGQIHSEKGIVVSILSNIQGVSMGPFALELLEEFYVAE